MLDNPYKYLGPLDPVIDEDICASRKDDIQSVINSIGRGEYRMILGPRQMGKTTFLHLVQNTFNSPNFINFHFQTAPKKEEIFYQGLVNQFLKAIPHKKSKFSTITSNDPDMAFIDFLEHFRPREAGKIILLFDEIDSLQFLKNFLQLWRTVLHKRQWVKDLQRYIVITTGSMHLLAITSSPNSPYNIAQPLYLKDLSNEECEKIIDKPFNKLNIVIEGNAKQMLLSQLSGHPQMLLHACHILVENAKDSPKTIAQNDVIKAIEYLFLDNITLDTLKTNLHENSSLQDIVIDILKGKEKPYHPYKDLALLGAGAFKEENSICKIRNPIYERFILDILNNPVKETGLKSEEEPEEEEKEMADSPNKKNVKILFWILFGILCILTAILFIIAVITNNPVLIAGAVIPAMFALSLLQSLKGDKNEN